MAARAALARHNNPACARPDPVQLPSGGNKLWNFYDINWLPARSFTNRALKADLRNDLGMGMMTLSAGG